METRLDTTRLKEMRTQARLTQRDVALALGYKSALGYHYIESGRCRLRADQLPALARILGVQVEELLPGPESRNNTA